MNPLDTRHTTIAEEARAEEVAASRSLISEMLSDELLLKVFSFLNPRSLATVPLVSRAWRQIAYMSPTDHRLNECSQRIPALKWSPAIYGSRLRETYLNFWKTQHQRTDLIRAPFPLYPKGLADDMERESIISFCRALPNAVRATLPSLENNGITLEARAENLLFELNNETVRNVTNLNLSNKNLTSIPKGVLQHFKNLEMIDLSRNQLQELPAGIFQGLTALNYLLLNNNQLKELPEGIFQGLTALEEIYLSRNQLQELPEGIFQGLTALEEIYLSRNQLQELPAGIFQGLTALQTISLEHNQLKELPAGIFQGLTALDTVDLEHNQLQTGPNKIQGLKTLMDSEKKQDQLLQFASQVGGLFLDQVKYNIAQSEKVKQQVMDWLGELKE